MSGMIDFNVPPFTGKEMEYMKQAVENRKISGDGMFTKKCAYHFCEIQRQGKILADL